MHRIYSAEITKDYVLRTTFFNGEVREICIESELKGNKSYRHLLKYVELARSLTINKARTAVELIGGPKFSYSDVYEGGLLKEIVVIDNINVQIASRIQQMRESKGLTQKNIEAITGIHQAEISKIERAVGNPSIATLEKIASAAGHRMNVIFEDRGIKKNVPEALGVAKYLKSGKYQGEYVISDLDDIPEDMKVELIDGCIYDLAAPSIMHQEIVGEMSFLIRDFIKKKKGECTVLDGAGQVFVNDDKNLLIPDIMVVCDKSKLEYKNVVGAADFIIEVASPGNSRRDYGIKQTVYMENGVREYWIIDPKRRKLVVYINDGEACPEIHNFSETVGVGIYDGELTIDLRDVDRIVTKYE